MGEPGRCWSRNEDLDYPSDVPAALPHGGPEKLAAVQLMVADNCRSPQVSRRRRSHFQCFTPLFFVWGATNGLHGGAGRVRDRPRPPQVEKVTLKLRVTQPTSRFRPPQKLILVGPKISHVGIPCRKYFSSPANFPAGRTLSRGAQSVKVTGLAQNFQVGPIF
jgi:hypothetical protein